MSSLISDPLKSSLMSVMPETSQVSIWPYLSSAAVWLALYSSTAPFSTALSAKSDGSARRRPLIVGTGVLAARSDERDKSCAV
eukprot:scaffold4683_cov69-Phaeocystis_antarctica.AAC.2